MKRLSKAWAVSLAALMLATGVSMGVNMAVNGVSKVNYSFVINQKQVALPSDYLVMSKNNTTYVPLRFLSEQLGAAVDYKSGTISIDAAPTTTMSQPTDSKKITELEAEVAKLKKQNDELTKQLDAINNSMTYRKLPTAQNSTNDLNIKLLQIAKDGTDAKFTVEFTNKSDDRYFVVDPFKTVVNVNGKAYKATLATDAKLNSTISGKDAKLYGTIIIGEMNDINVKGSVVFTLRDNGEKDDYVTIYFDNTK